MPTTSPRNIGYCLNRWDLCRAANVLITYYTILPLLKAAMHVKVYPNWYYLGYQHPRHNCILLDLKYAKNSNITRNICSEELQLMNKNDYFKNRITHCEVALTESNDDIDTHLKLTALHSKCSEDATSVECSGYLDLLSDCEPWSIFQWLFTPHPGVFGLVSG